MQSQLYQVRCNYSCIKWSTSPCFPMYECQTGRFSQKPISPWKCVNHHAASVHCFPMAFSGYLTDSSAWITAAVYIAWNSWSCMTYILLLTYGPLPHPSHTQCLSSDFPSCFHDKSCTFLLSGMPFLLSVTWQVLSLMSSPLCNLPYLFSVLHTLVRVDCGPCF